MRSRKRPQPTSNCYSIIGGTVVGTFDPRYRAELETRAQAVGLTFDQFMVRRDNAMLRSLLVL
jgi:hypothetical protein